MDLRDLGIALSQLGKLGGMFRAPIQGLTTGVEQGNPFESIFPTIGSGKNAVMFTPPGTESLLNALLLYGAQQGMTRPSELEQSETDLNRAKTKKLGESRGKGGGGFDPFKKK